MKGPWKGFDDVEYATLDWIDWYNNRRLFKPTGMILPAEYEANCYQEHEPQPTGARLN